MCGWASQGRLVGLFSDRARGLFETPALHAGTYNKATNRGGANGSLRFELGSRPNTNKNIIDAAGLCDRWRIMINQALAVDPKVGREHKWGLLPGRRGEVSPRGCRCSLSHIVHTVSHPPSPLPQVPRGVQISVADVYQLIGAAVVVTTGGSSKAEIFDSLPVGRKDANAADNVAQMPGGGISWNNLACLFCECSEWHNGGCRCREGGASIVQSGQAVLLVSCSCHASLSFTLALRLPLAVQ